MNVKLKYKKTFKKFLNKIINYKEYVNLYKNKNIKYYKQYKFNIIIFKNISLLKLSNIINLKYNKLIFKLIKLKIIISNEYIIKKKTIYLILKCFSNKIILYNNKFKKKKKKFKKNLIKKSPIVTIMGHVNHGKTTLLDYIRSTKLVLQESGGITQHIGVYNIKTKYGIITFFDTPGHEAFTSMRKRGVKNTDIIVLIIAANDKVMSQTIETIKYSKKLNIPLIIAINKIDKINLNINTIENELAQYGIISEKWGGEIQFINISAKTGEGVNNLIKSILILSEILELREKKKKISKGVVLESYFDKNNGPIVTILLKQGILKKGDIIIYNFEYNHIKSMYNTFGKKINLVNSSVPIEIIGFPIMPKIGEKIFFINDENKIKNFLEKKKKTNIIKNKKEGDKNNINNLNKIKIYKINIILKSDVLGSCEVIKNELLKLTNEKIKINIISLGIGNISKNDLILALNNNAIILAFNVYAEYSIRKIINLKNLDIRYYSIIYKLINDIKKEINLIILNNNKKIIGLANVLNVFKFEKLGLIAGCLITHGVIKTKNKIKILRNNKIIYTGKIESIKCFKENVKEVNNGMKCGIYIKNFKNFKIKDKIEAF